MPRFLLLFLATTILFCSVNCTFRSVHDDVIGYRHDVILQFDKLQKSVNTTNQIQDKSLRGDFQSFSVMRLRDIRYEDFVRVVFENIVKRPYVLDRSVLSLNKRVDVDIPFGRVNIIAVVVMLSERIGVDVDDVGGVVIFSLSKKDLSSSGDSLSKVSSSADGLSKVSSFPKGSDRSVNLVPADCIFTFLPVFSRAQDLLAAVAGLLGSESRVIVNDASNTLIVKCTDRERVAVQKLLRILDVSRLQVAVDCTIAEVSMIDDLSVGLEGFLRSGGADFTEVRSGTVVNNGLGFIGSVFISDWLRVVLQMGQQKGLIRIRSNPFLLISDGAESLIEIGTEYPILTQSKTSDEGEGILNAVDYRKTGLILRVRPVVSGEHVHLSVSLELSEGHKNDVSNIDSPIVLSRRMTSNNVILSGQSLLIGGMIFDSKRDEDRFFPFRRGLLLGRSAYSDRSELVIVLAVRVLSDDNQVDVYRMLSAKFNNHEIVGIGVK